jgi:hypothetical protein
MMERSCDEIHRAQIHLALSLRRLLYGSHSWFNARGWSGVITLALVFLAPEIAERLADTRIWQPREA